MKASPHGERSFLGEGVESLSPAFFRAFYIGLSVFENNKCELQHNHLSIN